MKIVDYGQGLDYTIEIIAFPNLGGARFIVQPARGLISLPGANTLDKAMFEDYLKAMQKALFHLGWTVEFKQASTPEPPKEMPPQP